MTEPDRDRRSVTEPFVCLDCGFASHHPMDKHYRYCIRCHKFTDDPTMEQSREIMGPAADRRLARGTP